MPKKKIIIVGASLGRTGSSALMGLLKLANVNVGGLYTGFRVSIHNPKGVFEIKGNNDFMDKIYPAHNRRFGSPPQDLLDFRKVARHNLPKFRNYIDREFGKRFPIAIKGLRFLVLPFAYELRKEYDVRVVMLNRPIGDRIRSALAKVDASRRKQLQKKVSKLNYNWEEFGNNISTYFPDVPYLSIDFIKLVNRPIATMKKVSKFLGIDCPDKVSINSWIDPKMTIHYKGIK